MSERDPSQLPVPGEPAAHEQPGSEVATDAAALLILAQEAGGFGIFDWWVKTGSVALSRNLQSLYGLTSFDGRYELLMDLVFREDVVRIKRSLEEIFSANSKEINEEFRIVRSDDRTLKWMEARGIIYYDNARNADRLIAVCVDITERKRSTVQLRAFANTLEEKVRERTRELEIENEARRKAETALRQAQKIEAVGQLTGGVAHDFNNLLTVIMGGLEITNRHLPSIPASPPALRIRRATDMALEGVRRAALLTQRLLAFARQQPLAPQPIDPNKLVAGISELLRHTVGEIISLETVMTGGLWEAHADPEQLENTLVNLAVNARDAMPTGGTLTIETQNCFLDDAYVATFPEPVKPGQYVMIGVADLGTGMDAGTLERAFEPFFTTKEVGKGTGLGLSQVYGFVRQSSGHVRIYSGRDQGTTVKIYLPRYMGDYKKSDPASARHDVYRAIENEWILVVEDDEILRSNTTETLTELGYNVLAAKHGPDALRILDQSEQVDVLFTDIVMPGGMNGRQLADEAVQRRPGLKVLFTTGYSRNAIVHQGRLDPGVQLIGKPYSIDALAAKLREILDGSAESRPSTT